MRNSWTTGLIAAACGVLIWRVVALLTADPSVIRALLAGLGLVFVVCGLLVFSKIPTEAGLLFAGFCMCSGLHWGGPLELESGQLRTALLLLYLLVSSFLGASYLLHLALCFPTRSRLADKKFVIWLLYAPVAVATLLAVVYLLSSAEGSLHATTESLFMVLHAIVSNLFAVVAFAFFVSHIFRAGLTRAKKSYVGLMAVGMLIAWVPYLVASAVGVETDPWNLTVVALPISFAIAMFGIDRRRIRTRQEVCG